MTEHKITGTEQRERRPSHPGALLREIVIPGTNATATAIAAAMKISRQALHNITTESSPVTANIAVRLAAVFGGSAQSWLNMQSAYDVWNAEKELEKENIKTLVYA